VTTYYADSSALVKRYVNELGSDWVREICLPEGDNVIALAHIGLVEIAAALGIKHRQGLLDASVRDGLLRDLQRDGYDQYWLVDVDQELVLRAIDLTCRHKLRGYDAIHLASALFLQETLLAHNLAVPVLLSADEELVTAAQAEGLETNDPNEHP
jgi:predicted nucleic acid-binding protein